MATTRLEKIPNDVHRLIIKKQGEIKVIKGHNRFSIPSTIYAIIREWAKNKKNEG